MAKAKKTEEKPVQATASKENKLSTNEISDAFEELLDDEKTSDDTFYVVQDSNDPILLKIFVNAPGQTCHSRIELDDDVFEEDHNGSLGEAPLGPGNTVAGKTLFVVSTVTNTAGQKGKAEVTVSLKGGPQPADDALFKTLDANDTVIFKYICKFFKARQ